MATDYMFQDFRVIEHLLKLIGNVTWSFIIVLIPFRVTKDAYDTFQISLIETIHTILIEVLLEEKVVNMGMRVDVFVEISVGINLIAIIELTRIQWKVG